MVHGKGAICEAAEMVHLRNDRVCQRVFVGGKGNHSDGNHHGEQNLENGDLLDHGSEGSVSLWHAVLASDRGSRLQTTKASTGGHVHLRHHEEESSINRHSNFLCLI